MRRPCGHGRANNCARSHFGMDRTNGKSKAQRRRICPAAQAFEQSVHQIVFRAYVETIAATQDRCD